MAFLKQAGVKAEELRIERDAGLRGNSHMMMVEKNNREVLQPILNWLDKNVTGSAPAYKKRGTDSTALRLADMGYFWIGAEPRKMDYGTIVSGQIYVQYLIPEQIRQPLPIVLVHGGGGQSTDYMGLDGNASWAHYYVQAGYQVYLVDRPGHGRVPNHPDTTGPIGAMPTYDFVSGQLRRGATGTPRRWAGTGLPGDPLLDQWMASSNAAPTNNAAMMELWKSRGGMLLDKIGPAIIQTHSAGGPFGWLTADARPNLVKAIVCFEGAPAPLVGPGRGGAAAGQPQEHPHPVLRGREFRLHVRPAAAAGVEAVGRGRGVPELEGPRHQRQQPLRDGGDQPQGDLRGAARLDREQVARARKHDRAALGAPGSGLQAPGLAKATAAGGRRRHE